MNYGSFMKTNQESKPDGLHILDRNATRQTQKLDSMLLGQRMLKRRAPYTLKPHCRDFLCGWDLHWGEICMAIAL